MITHNLTTIGKILAYDGLHTPCVVETTTDEAAYQEPHCLNTQTTLLQGNTV